MKIIKKLLEYAIVILVFLYIVNRINLTKIENVLSTFNIKIPVNDVEISYRVLSPLSPAIYNYEDSIVKVTVSSLKPVSGTINVEFTGITLPYEQSFLVTGRKEFNIKPVLLPQVDEIFKEAKDVQFKIEVKDPSGKRLYVKSEKVRMLSRNDMIWKLSDGSDLSPLITSWVTPENAEVRKLLRMAVDYLDRYKLSDTKKTGAKYTLKAIAGYVNQTNVKKQDLIFAQMAAIFDAMKDGYKIRYVSDIETGRSDNSQSIKFPEEVLKLRSGLCIETVVTMASACEAAGMNPVILINENHAILGVETSPGSNEYVFWETTDLTESSQKAYQDGVKFYNSNKNNKNLRIIDIKKARDQGIKPLG